MSKHLLPEQEIISYIEEERKRIARDIHDGPAQNLANIVFRMEFLEQLLKKGESIAAQEELLVLKEIVKRSLREIKDFIFNIRPMSLDDLGLIPALKKHTEKYEKEFGIKTNFIIIGEESKIKKEIEVGIFRIIQEALINIAKHSRAKESSILLDFEDNNLNLSITDDGCGFNVQEVNAGQKKNLGLLSMKERAEVLGGMFQINSIVGKGTRITLKIPL